MGIKKVAEATNKSRLLMTLEYQSPLSSRRKYVQSAAFDRAAGIRLDENMGPSTTGACELLRDCAAQSPIPIFRHKCPNHLPYSAVDTELSTTSYSLKLLTLSPKPYSPPEVDRIRGISSL